MTMEEFYSRTRNLAEFVGDEPNSEQNFSGKNSNVFSTEALGSLKMTENSKKKAKKVSFDSSSESSDSESGSLRRIPNRSQILKNIEF